MARSTRLACSAGSGSPGQRGRGRFQPRSTSLIWHDTLPDSPHPVSRSMIDRRTGGTVIRRFNAAGSSTLYTIEPVCSLVDSACACWLLSVFEGIIPATPPSEHWEKYYGHLAC